jgi:hypothetical protein
MRFNIGLLLSLPLVSFSLASYDRQAGIFRRDLCTDNGDADCDYSCMPADAVCCHFGSGAFCEAGTVCNREGCCPVGQECIGSAGTMTYYVSLTGAGAAPTEGAAATTEAGPPAANTFTVAPIDASTTTAAANTETEAGGISVQTSATHSTAGVTFSTKTTSSGGESTPAAQIGGASSGNSKGSELYAIVLLAAGQFLLM